MLHSSVVDKSINTVTIKDRLSSPCHFLKHILGILCVQRFLPLLLFWQYASVFSRSRCTSSSCTGTWGQKRMILQRRFRWHVLSFFHHLRPHHVFDHLFLVLASSDAKKVAGGADEQRGAESDIDGPADPRSHAEPVAVNGHGEPLVVLATGHALLRVLFFEIHCQAPNNNVRTYMLMTVPVAIPHMALLGRKEGLN